MLAYGLADTVGVHFSMSSSDHQLMFLQAGLVETDRWGDLGELEARYGEAVARESPVSVDPYLAVLPGWPHDQARPRWAP